jgi:uncharacterized protein GlcG (DUF336 family)
MLTTLPNFTSSQDNVLTTDHGQVIGAIGRSGAPRAVQEEDVAKAGVAGRSSRLRDFCDLIESGGSVMD